MKNQNKFVLQMSIAAILIVGGLAVYNACSKHKNVVQTRTSNKLLVKDTKNNQERIIVFDSNNYNEMQYLYTGDTVIIQNASYPGAYFRTKVYDATHFVVDKDLIRVRTKKQNFDSVKNAMLAESGVKQR